MAVEVAGALDVEIGKPADVQNLYEKISKELLKNFKKKYKKISQEKCTWKI
jgi:hypothetical protein